MPILGLMTKGEVENLLEEAIKRVSKSKPQFPGWALQTADSQSYRIPDLSIYGNQADLYRRLSWVLAAIDLVAQATTMVGFSVKERGKGEKLTEVENHPFELLLQKPNPVDSRHELLYATVAMWKLTGNGYWWLNKANEKAPPDEIWHIPSHMIYPVPDGKMYIKGYIYEVEDGRRVALEPWEVVHFRRFNPYNRFLGLSAIESLATVATGDLGMQEWNTKLFKENNARLPGIITFEQFIEDGAWEQIKDETREKAAKRDIMMLRGVGQGGVNWLQAGVSQKDMEFLAGRQFNKEEIFSVLAPGAASILAINATEANAKTGRATLMEYGVYSMLVVMQEKITAQILNLYGDNLIGEFDDPRIFDKAVELDEIATYSTTHTVAEVRDKYYNDDPVGDERDDLFPAQIVAPMMPFGAEPQGMGQGGQSVNGAGNPNEVNPEEEGEVDIENYRMEDKDETEPKGAKGTKAINTKALVELDNWERKCQKTGKLVTWHPVDLPKSLHDYIKEPGVFSIGRFSDAREQIKSGLEPDEAMGSPMSAKSETELLMSKIDEAIIAYKAGFRPDQSRGSDGKWIDEGRGDRGQSSWHDSVMAPNKFAYSNVTETDWNNLERAMRLETPEAKAKLAELGMTKEQVQEAIRQAEIDIQNIPHTIDKHKIDGVYTEERQKLHDQIVEKLLANGVAQENPNVLFSGGLPGAGKSSVLDLEFYKKRTGGYIKLDSDIIKGMLAKEDGIAKLGVEAASYHLEADDILMRLEQAAIQNRFSIVYDTTMKTTSKFVKMISGFKENGYTVEVAFIDVHPVTSMTRAIFRFVGGGRYVSIPYIATHDHKNASTARALKELSDVWRFWSNEVPKDTMPILIEEK